MRPKRVLIADNNQDFRTLSSHRIKKAFDSEIIEVSSAFEAIEFIRELHPDLVICDFMNNILGRYSGLDVFDFLKLHPEIETRFILFTTNTDAAGFRDEDLCVVDKCRLDELVEAAEFLLGIAHSRD